MPINMFFLGYSDHCYPEEVVEDVTPADPRFFFQMMEFRLRRELTSFMRRLFCLVHRSCVGIYVGTLHVGEAA